ncbi:hypothetical protein QP936_004255 [Corynebacterium rhinophilum]|uniref:hypothetical protein n=2 Tax=Corynebacterium rhinophilum TaxID=3050197 RepID=UPI00254B2F3B|nr:MULTISPECIES: hypothetical protein [unclassified Corynebacterium]MDK8492293.1 hypothetical protein [Corynebacterium sp. MSK175]MDK8766580.1 hypothetical protein [Corynebacterium sp. MSK293]MDK8831106.1 hypothetical protein [Corynebacterium sp. MSK072]
MVKQYRRYLSAELLRCRGSAVQWLPLLALPLVLMTVFFSAFASSAEDATGVLGWQSMFITGMYAPLIALFAGIPERREALSRSGGTLWRRLNPRYEHASRFLIVVASLAVFHLLNFGLSWAAVAIQARAEHQLLIIAGAYSFLGAIGIAGLATAGARRLGLAVTLILAAIWQVISVLPRVVEGPLWWAFPPAWPLRLLLPALRIHQNSVPLEPGDPLLQESPLPALALCLTLAVASVFTATMTPRRVRPRSRPRGVTAPTTSTTATPAQGWRPATVSRAAAYSRLADALRGFYRVIMTPAVITCLALSALALIFIALIYPPSYVQGFFTLLLLPVGAGVLSVLVWPGFSGAWPIVYIESRHCSTALLLWLLGIIAVVCTCASVAVIFAGGAALTVLAQLPLAVGVGYVLTVISLIVVIRFGIWSSLALTIVGIIVSVTVGGDVLAKTVLWLIAFPAWPMNADSPVRYAAAAMMTLLFAAITSWAARRLLRTRALRPTA